MYAVCFLTFQTCWINGWLTTSSDLYFVVGTDHLEWPSSQIHNALPILLYYPVFLQTAPILTCICVFSWLIDILFFIRYCASDFPDLVCSVTVHISVVVLVPWSWSRGASRPALLGLGLGLEIGSWFLNCVLSWTVLIKLYVGDHNAYWLMCKSGDISVVYTRYSLHSAFTYLLFLCRQHKCKVVGASHIKQTVPATCLCCFRKFFLRRADFQQQWSSDETTSCLHGRSVTEHVGFPYMQ